MSCASSTALSWMTWYAIAQCSGWLSGCPGCALDTVATRHAGGPCIALHCVECRPSHCDAPVQRSEGVQQLVCTA